MMNAGRVFVRYAKKDFSFFGFLRLIAWIKKVQDPFMKSLLVILSILLFLGSML